jgi:prepilin-type N-terminal cleavage/methylation domain-containing protein
MIKKGYTLIEVIASLAILCIIVFISFDFLGHSNRVYSSINTSIEEKANVRIAMEFVYSCMRDGKQIKFQNNVLTIDNKDIYVKNGILRYGSDSEQIAPLVTNIQVVDKGMGLYKILIFSDEYLQSTFVKKRNI